jgi:DNA-directed RNA polymerase subunit F|tara:strand:- start:460 stop:636 length:177 start_codon:yes stop_codon:yes gene_type:complete
MTKQTKGDHCINRNICKVVKETRNELKSILKDYHYESDTENMSKDVVVALENLVGDLR